MIFNLFYKVYLNKEWHTRDCYDIKGIYVAICRVLNLKLRLTPNVVLIANFLYRMYTYNNDKPQTGVRPVYNGPEIKKKCHKSFIVFEL